MTKIKIISNPYTRTIEYQTYKEQSQEWKNITSDNPDSKLREDITGKNFLPFKIKEIMDIIVAEYYTSEKIEVIFDGTKDDYDEVRIVCEGDEFEDKIQLSRGTYYLENARHIFEPIKDIFETIQPIIESIVKNDENVKRDLSKVADALKDIIPICVFGNYSAGKSTFINALIGSEVLPSGGDPVTAKIYRIENTRYEDTAKIRFGYKEEEFEILFEGMDYRLIKGKVENELIQDIFSKIKETEGTDLARVVNCALEIINGYEKRDEKDIVISNIIEVEVPFSRNGVLGQSYNKFVIFDTPGSNSASNLEHSMVLAEALEGFSNGIPVWISTYETIDSTDNGKLCDDILEIRALDKRFTMIIMNKADGSDLDEEGFSTKKEQEILEYSSVEKMFASGIYFVSSILGIGAKKSGALVDKHYRKIYRSQLDMYEDPEDEDYASLYKYNIMPKQMKSLAMDYSLTCPDLVYANSGLYCVEKEMENFASKHAAYNKCQMVHMFLEQVFEETDRRINESTELLKENRQARTKELEIKKADLIENLKNEASKREGEFKENYENFIKAFINEQLNLKYTVEELEKKSSNLREEKAEETCLEIHKKEYADNNAKFWINMIENGKVIVKREGTFRDTIKKAKEDFNNDFRDLQKSKAEKAATEKNVEKEASDTLLKQVVEEYKKNILEAQEKAGSEIKQYWQQNAQILKTELINIIAGTDALSSKQQEELLQLIISYQPIEFKDDTDSVFSKSKFLKGSLLGFRFLDYEKLNIKKLTNIYNEKILETIHSMSGEMNESSESSFHLWKEQLALVIEENIIIYNPQLREMSNLIKEETEKIAELEGHQVTICSSLNAIKGLMSWKAVN